jgi:hypothetical protein
MLNLRNKKGAIELSITGIVVLIIAITVLGLILGFVRGYFKKAAEGVETPLKEIEDTVKRQLESSGRTVIISPEDVELKSGSSKEVFLGARNLQSSPEAPRICHLIGVYCLSPFTGESCTEQGNDVLVAGRSPESPEAVTGSASWFSLLKSNPDIDNLGSFVQKATMKVPRAVKPDTYDMELRLFYDTGLQPCTQASGNWEQVDSYRFSLTIK